MASNQPQAGSSASTTQEHTVRVPKDNRKIYKMMKFSTGIELDFVKLSQTPVKMEKENNFKEYKTANDIDQMPKFGAGSEFGREQKEIARKKKYGIMMKNYNPSDQPWIMKIGKNKETKRYKGVREGTITENTSYYIFTQCADGAFEAFPVEEWYNFSPMIRYKYLNSDEAEEEFSRRDKTLNYFSIMVRKRCRNDEDGDKAADDGEEGGKVTKSKSKGKDFLLTDMDEWFDMSEDEDADNEDDDEGTKPKKGKQLPKKNKKKRNAKHNSDDEAVEESDEGDYDDREVDYISDSGSSSEEEVAKKDKYEEKGVDEEQGLRKLIDSEEESEEEKKDENNEKENKSKKGSDSESSSSSSGEESDIEKDEGLTSAIFLQKGEEKRKSPVPRSGTPSATDADEKKALKRKLDPESSSSKKMRTDSPSLGSSKEGISEHAIRRYLTRKPMTPKELVQKFTKKKQNIPKEQRDKLTAEIAALVKKINPDKKIVNKVMYLSLKPDNS